MTNSRVLVTGGTGMIGRALIPLLVEQGFRVRVLVQSATEQLPFDSQVELQPGDILDGPSCRRATQGIDAVVHLAGRAHTRTHPELFFRVNVDGTRNLLEAAVHQGVSHFVFVSSAGVYGEGRPEPFAEANVPYPITPYGLSKLKAEQVVEEIAKLTGISHTILRPSVVYGASDRGNVLRMIRAIDSRFFAMVGRGNTRKSMTYVQNVADVVGLCLSSERARNETFNIADPEPYAIGDLSRTIAQVLGKPLRSVSVPAGLAKVGALGLQLACRAVGKSPVVTLRDIRVLTTDMVLDVNKLHNVLGYRSRVLLLDGLIATNSWYQQTRKSE